jgi:hypothetical protein
MFTPPGEHEVEVLRQFERTYNGKLLARTEGTAANEALAAAAITWLAAQKASRTARPPTPRVTGTRGWTPGSTQTPSSSTRPDSGSAADDGGRGGEDHRGCGDQEQDEGEAGGRFGGGPVCGKSRGGRRG